MKRLEHWILRIADSDLTWIGFNWMRPAKQRRLSVGYILLSSFLLALPGIAVGAGLLYAIRGQVEPKVWLALFALAMAIDLSLHAVFARYWNRRAATLADKSDENR
jgi:ABC-type Fe3+ transport system permease subunit